MVKFIYTNGKYINRMALRTLCLSIMEKAATFTNV